MKTSTPRRKRKATVETEEFSFSAGAARYANKDQYIANDLIFTILAVELQPKLGYQGSDRWAVTVSREDGWPPEIITLPTNEKRNVQLHAARARIETKGPILNVRLVKANGTFYFRTAEPHGS